MLPDKLQDLAERIRALEANDSTPAPPEATDDRIFWVVLILIAMVVYLVVLTFYPYHVASWRG